MWLGELSAGDTIDFKFSTRGTTGAPTQLAGSPAISVYKANGTTESTTGVTLTVDFDSRAGLNHVRITTGSDGTFYADGQDFQVVITAGTVGGTSVVGEVVGHFSLRNRAGLKPTTAGRTLDVSAGGEAGVDWANVGSPSTSVNLSATTVNLVNTLTTYTGNTPQTGDGYAVVASGSHGNAALKTLIDTLDDYVDTEVAAIKAKTDNLPASFPTNFPILAIDASGRMQVQYGTSTGQIALTAGQLTSSTLAASAGAALADYVYDEALSGHTTSGTAGEALNRLDDIQSKTDLISSAAIEVSSPITVDGDMEVVQGASYYTADGRNFDFINAAGTWADLSNATVTFYAKNGDLSASMSVVTATGANQKVRLQLTEGQVASLGDPGIYPYEVKAVLQTTSHPVVLAQGDIEVVDSQAF